MNKYNFQFLGWRLILNSTFLILNSKVNPPVNFVDILPYKGRQTPLTPLHRGGLGLLAFSLIELSIVLIIIGLLVAGVTGGKSLIESAKTRAFMNEIRNYNQAFTTFYVANGRLPGDANRDGKINHNDTNFYDFKDKDKYANVLSHGETDLHIVAPWVELYDEKIIDFIPPISECDDDYAWYECVKPSSKNFKDYKYDIFNGGDWNYYNTIDDFDGDAIEGRVSIANKVLLKLKYLKYKSYNLSTLIKTDIIKQIDEKTDDGVRDSGRFRAICFDKNRNIDWDDYQSSYQDLKDGGCINIYNVLDIN